MHWSLLESAEASFPLLRRVIDHNNDSLTKEFLTEPVRKQGLKKLLHFLAP